MIIYKKLQKMLQIDIEDYIQISGKIKIGKKMEKEKNITIIMVN